MITDAVEKIEDVKVGKDYRLLPLGGGLPVEVGRCLDKRGRRAFFITVGTAPAAGPGFYVKGPGFAGVGVGTRILEIGPKGWWRENVKCGYALEAVNISDLKKV